jgi:hypothetical protein
MKKLLLTLAALLPLGASALTLESAQCNAYCTCLSVQTNLGQEINFLNPNSVSFDPENTYTGSGSSYPMQMFSPNGGMLVADLQFTRWATRTVSGRGAGARIQHCVLTGGTITFPTSPQTQSGVGQKPWFVD